MRSEEYFGDFCRPREIDRIFCFRNIGMCTAGELVKNAVQGLPTSIVEIGFVIGGLDKVHPGGASFIIDENPVGSDCERQLRGDGLDNRAEAERFIVGEFLKNQELLVGAVGWMLMVSKVSLSEFGEWCQSLYISSRVREVLNGL